MSSANATGAPCGDEAAISAALRAIDPAESIAILRDLIAVESIWGNEKPLALHLAARFREWGFDEVHLVDDPAGRPSVVARIAGTGGGKSLLLNGHIDMYELSADWTMDPWTLVVRDGKAYGGGIDDMKGGVAAQVAAARFLRASGVRLAGDVLVSCVAAHFEGGVGTRAILAAGFTADGAIVAEPSSMDIVVAQRGAAYINVTTRGKQAHATASDQGVNAIMQMVRFVTALERLEIPYEPHPLLGGPPSLNVGTIHGGTKHNQVPDRCTISIDLRILPSQSADDVKQRIERLVAELHDADPTFVADVAFNPHWLSGPRIPFEVDPHWEIVPTVAEAYRLASGRTAERKGVNGWTDMAVLGTAGIQCVTIGPGDPPYNFADEYIAFDQYHDAVKTYVAAAMMFCQEQ